MHLTYCAVSATRHLFHSPGFSFRESTSPGPKMWCRTRSSKCGSAAANGTRRKLREDDHGLQAYLLRSVYNRCINYIKRARRNNLFTGEYEERLLSLAGDCWSPDRNPVIRSIFNADLRDIISEAVSSLSPRCKEVFTLSYIDNLTNKEISERLGISLSTVENHMYIALRQLRSSLAGV